jgi:hypothetical protein
MGPMGYITLYTNRFVCCKFDERKKGKKVWGGVFSFVNRVGLQLYQNCNMWRFWVFQKCWRCWNFNWHECGCQNPTDSCNIIFGQGKSSIEYDPPNIAKRWRRASSVQLWKRSLDLGFWMMIPPELLNNQYELYFCTSLQKLFLDPWIEFHMI